jgi:SAM-dependent methyltransferase
VSAVKASQVDPTNINQARAWDGDEGVYWASHAEYFDKALGAYHDQFMAAAEIEPGDRVLDIGCGTGQTTRDAAHATLDGTAMGVDLSAEMIEFARCLALEQGLVNARFEQADAQIYPFDAGGFDVAISRTGTMFFGDPGAAFTNIARAVRPRGRLALLVWQGPWQNEWIRELGSALAAGSELSPPPVGAPGPFGQADPDRVRAVLSAAGFHDICIGGLSGPMWFGAEPGEAHDFVIGLMGWMVENLDHARRAQALKNLENTLNSHATDNGVRFESTTWLITASRG